MLRKFSVSNLHGRLDCDLQLHDDINILTGRNGCGKTTVLKLMWYMTSGNIERIPREMWFDEARVETDSYRLLITMDDKKHRALQWQLDRSDTASQIPLPLDGDDGVVEEDSVETANRMVSQVGASIFFPTFRRIEGGFSMGRNTRAHPLRGELFPFEPEPNRVESSLRQFAQRLSVRHHRFVASVSTDDIVTSLTRQYANISEAVNEGYAAISREMVALLTQQVQEAETSTAEAEKLRSAYETLERVRDMMRAYMAKQELLLRPFSSLSGEIGRIFQHRGIRVTSRVTLGQAEEAIGSDKLSAGEKQMLSFLVYNAFASNASIFIDEPEISLHVDWQRQLFPTLLGQGTSNQFIVATHSPFIYSRYADRELVLATDRGE